MKRAAALTLLMSTVAGCGGEDPDRRPDRSDDSAADDSDADSQPCEPSTWYADTDGDGFGDVEATVTDCVQPVGYVANASDCDDTLEQVHPGAAEVCNILDDDCNGLVDDDATDTSTSYTDADGDGYGDPTSARIGCSPPPDSVDGGSDCDDAADDIFPGALDACGDGVDGDCDGFDDACVSGAHAPADADATFYGPTFNAQLGYGLDGVGDVDGDGLDDILLGAILDATAGAYAGMGYVVPSPIDASTALTSGAGLAGSPGDSAGAAVRAAGDLDGDGNRDVLISASEGAYVAVVAGPIPADVDLRADTVVITTVRPISYFGSVRTVDAGGDVDGDGLADVLLGAPGGASGACFGPGSAYLLRGPLTAGDVEVEAWATFHGGADGDCTGVAVAVGGDLDGDGLADVVIGASEDGSVGVRAGAVYVWNDPSPGSHDPSDSPIALTGEIAGDEAGNAVESTGDVDGDGYADLLVGASSAARGGPSAGAAYLMLGPITRSRSLAEADAILVGESAADLAAMAVSNDGGDVDADGRADILVGAPYLTGATVYTGRAYLFVGPPSGVVSLATADATYDGDAYRTFMGYDVSTAGDLTGDGFDDILIGAPGESSHAAGAGAVYVFDGGEL